MTDRITEAARRAEIDLTSARNSGLWSQAVEFLKKELEPIAADIRMKIRNPGPYGWIAPYHFGWGMAIRNLLRQNGYGEKELHVENLDNVYVELIEEAIGK